ncbi:head GIN domain-containing protein [Rufibacter psychrotolerans]|uniref:head GIN domain-containing protein n=1 Tax=Rufibacter psychrotolerans TaxID=2812556 RepID=UPI0019688C0C|nr:head GIN domain-containing protein [Rufibacter sp. SYSU D00308]
MRLNTLLSLFFSFCSLGLLASCDILGSGPCLEGGGAVKTVTRDVPAFKGVDMRVAGNVIITEGPEVEVRVESFANLLPEIITEVAGSTLVIRSGTCLEFNNEETTVYVTLPQVELVELRSSGQVRVQAAPSTQRVNMNLSGSGAIRYVGNAQSVHVRHSGSGDIFLEGSASKLETNSSGSGSIQAYFLHADTATVFSSGSGHQQIWVNRALDATLSGSGNIYYRGYPNLISSLTSGSGKVINDNK